ncbi:MAG: sortase [Candidatus Microsaccharimonas sp.]
MNPNNGSQGGGTPNPSTPQEQQSAAANLIRSQIDALYGGEPVASSQQPAAPQQPTVSPRTRQYINAEPSRTGQAQVSYSPQAQQSVAQPASGNTPAASTLNHQLEDINPYERTHTPHPQPQADQWKAYHSAWQNYYQKYYEAYYTQQQASVEAIGPIGSASNQTADQPESKTKYLTQQTDLEKTTEDLSRDQALHELRQKLLGKVRTQAKKIRRSRHFIPIAAALAVVLIFVFLQYNRVLIASVNAYVSPGAIDSQNIVIDPGSDAEVGPESKLIIPKINVDVPAIYGIGFDHASQMTAMESGVAHFAIPGANSKPGEIGNTVLSGHSSNDLFDGGDYKFIFAQLDKLNAGDTIYTNYEGKRYTYVVTKKEVVKPTEVNKLVYPTNKPMLTLITCTPLGTAIDRLLVTAEQISPDPAAAASAPEGSGQSGGQEAAIPGNSPTMLERLFGAR